MKKSIAIRAAVASLFLSLTVILTSFGQESHWAILLNEANSRLNYGEMNSALKDYKKDVRGFQGGLSWQAGLTKHLSIVTEAYFITKGGTVKVNNPVDGIRSTLKLRTMEIPVLARIHTGRFYFNAGPYVNYVFSGKKSSDTDGSHSISFGQNEFRRFEAGVQTGGGYQFRIKKTRLAVDLRYISGLTSVSRNEKLYNRTINLSVLVLRSSKPKA